MKLPEWSNGWFLSLPWPCRMMWLYLIDQDDDLFINYNPTVWTFHTGLEQPVIEIALKRLEADGMIARNEETLCLRKVIRFPGKRGPGADAVTLICEMCPPHPHIAPATQHVTVPEQEGK